MPILKLQVVINCALAGVQYAKVTPFNYLLGDQQQLYGLYFSTKEDAQVIWSAVNTALANFKRSRTGMSKES